MTTGVTCCHVLPSAAPNAMCLGTSLPQIDRQPPEFLQEITNACPITENALFIETNHFLTEISLES